MSKLGLLLLFCVALFKANGQVGSLDPTFGNKGIQTTGISTDAFNLSEQGHVVLVGPNGNIFVIARVVSNPSYTRIVKYLSDGSIDSSYGNQGYSKTTDLNVTSAIMEGGKIIVAGSISNTGIGDDFGLARYTANGSLDTSFGVNGIVKTNFNTDYSEGANAVAILEDKIIAAGYTLNSANFTEDIALACYNKNGILDSSFGENGKVVTDFNYSDDRANAIVLQGTKITVAGYTYNFGNVTNDFALARYSADGVLDSSFGENGLVKTNFYNLWSYANSAVLQREQIVLAGYTYDPFVGIYDFALARYTADGVLDSSFGATGKVTTDFNDFYDLANTMVLQGDKIIVAGNSHSDFALARYTVNGVLDSSFGVNGLVLTDFHDSQDDVNSLTLQGDKIVATGYAGYFPRDFAIARYNTDGKLDGKLTGNFPVTRTFFTSTAIKGGKMVTAGYAFNYNNDFAVARCKADGTLDSSFGNNGIVTTGFKNLDDEAKSVVLQGDRIIVGGYSGDGFNGFDFMLIRYTADGALDSSFGNNGIVKTDFVNSFDRSNSIALQGNKILVVGSAFNENNLTSDFVLVRYTANGGLDSTFGKNGRVITDFNNTYDNANSVVVQRDKIIVGGYTSDIFGSVDFALARYTSDGKLDASFGQNGIVTTDFNNYEDRVNEIALQGNKIIVGGNSGIFFDGFDYVLARYTANGILDPSFGENGKVTTDFRTPYGSTNSIAVQGDKIIVGGEVDNNIFSFARYTANGTLDSSFGENGKTATNLVGSSALRDIAVYLNRLYAVGSLTYGPDESYGLIAAYQLEAPEPSITISEITVMESEKLAIATVRLSVPATKRILVRVITLNKTATYSQDYIRIEDTLQFTRGTKTAKIFIPIVNDNSPEGTEQFEIVLTKAWHATISDSIGLVTILDDDNAVTTNGDDARLVVKQGTLQIKANPNPFVSTINIQLQGDSYKQPVIVRVYDLSGRIIEEGKNISIGQSLRLGDQYETGTYIVEAAQGSQKVQVKVIKFGK